MQYAIAIIIFLVGVVGVLFRNGQKKSVDATLAETKGEDKQLASQQTTLQDAVKQIDDGIAKAKAEREAQRQADENLSLKERADRLKKGLT